MESRAATAILVAASIRRSGRIEVVVSASGNSTGVGEEGRQLGQFQVTVRGLLWALRLLTLGRLPGQICPFASATVQVFVPTLRHLE